VLDGGGLVTLSGGGGSRILFLDSGFDTPTPRLVVQRLTFQPDRARPGWPRRGVPGPRTRRRDTTGTVETLKA